MPDREYRPAIDGLRAIAVLAVLVFHLNHRWLPGGFFGVDIFFVISGYLITSIVLEDCEGGRFQFRRFYQRRIARLLPAFVTVAIATAIAAELIYSPQDLASTGATLSAAVASVANLKFLVQGNYFALSPDSQPFLHCWSLSIEEQFYLLFPAAFLILCRRTREFRVHFLIGSCAVSLLTYLALDRARPEWAFYLLPARAWELLAGSILATIRRQRFRLSYAGAILIGASFLRGQDAILPVAGTVCLLLSGSERVLSWKPLVLLGRMSYSLYLWHWPVFSLVDYKLYWQPLAVRVVWKVLVSFGAAAMSFALIERPGRVVLNRPARRRFAFAALAFSLATLIPLGIALRDANYINADLRTIRQGGIGFNAAGRNGSMVLMGDSNASMYGKMAAEIARERGLRLHVISVEAGDPLPRSAAPDPPLWRGSLAAVRNQKPDYLVLVCNWSKLKDDRSRLSIALRELKPYARQILLITQPPVLPEDANREAIRNGSRPPFREDGEERASRMERNQFVKTAQSESISVIDIEPLFSREDGEIRFVDSQWRELYQDRDHLSAAGASLVKPELLKVMSGLSALR